MMNLKCEKEVVVKCEYQDLESLIKHIYGHEYEIMPMEEVGSSQYNATYDLTVSKDKLSQDEVENIQSLRLGRPIPYMLGDILTDLCNRDIIDSGEYIINVSW